MLSKQYDEAKKSFVAAEKIHNSERYLIETALDWYCIARACSMDGKKSEAVDAILKALKYDKDAENTNGIASDYNAYSRILLKGNPTEAEKKRAEELAEWSQKILKAKM
jgi:tetratricopeptide (TPR) repeat protein